MDFDLVMLVITMVLLLGNLLQSFFIYKSVDASKAQELFNTARAVADKTPSTFDDEALAKLQKLYDRLQSKNTTPPTN